MTERQAIEYLRDLALRNVSAGDRVTVRFASPYILYPAYVYPLEEYVGQSGVIEAIPNLGTSARVRFEDGVSWHFPWWALDYGHPFPQVPRTPTLHEAYQAVNGAFISGARSPMKVSRSWSSGELGVVCGSAGAPFPVIMPEELKNTSFPDLSIGVRWFPFWALEPISSYPIKKSAHSKPLPLP